MYAVIMAGGKGERFWPLSRKNTPKQCLKILSDKSMIEETVDRLGPLVPRDHVYISTGNHLYEPIKGVLPDVNFVLEPMAKNTAACIGLSAVHIMERDPGGIMFIETADHVYKNDDEYLRHVEAARAAAEDGKIVLIGIKPAFPATGYGYIHQGDAYGAGEVKMYSVKEFKEKPDRATAEQFLASGDYLWNSGMFMFKCSVIIEAMKELMPALYEGLMKIKDSGLDEAVTREEFEKLESISIDYGVMEKAANTVVVRGEMAWDDVGDWLAMERVLPRDGQDNVLKGECITIDTTGCTVFGDRLVATVGLKDVVVVSTPDAVLVCSKDRAQDVKQIVKQLNEKYT